MKDGRVCEGKFAYTGNPCHYPAKYLVTAPYAPNFVCGYHARAFVRKVLVPLQAERR